MDALIVAIWRIRFINKSKREKTPEVYLISTHKEKEKE